MLMTQDSIDRLKMLCMSVLSLRGWHGSLNPFLSAHIPYAQSEGILPKYGLLQWVEYISKSTQWISTKLCRDMVKALSFQKTLKYWWPLTYIQGHVIQDGRQIHFSKSNLGLKLPIAQPIFGQIQSFLFCFVAGDQFSTLDGKAIPTMVPCVFWLQRNDPPILLFTTMENCIVTIFNWEWWENWSKLSQCQPWYLCNDI